MEHHKHLLPGETQKDMFLKLGHRQRLSQSSHSEDQHESDVQSFATELSHLRVKESQVTPLADLELCQASGRQVSKTWIEGVPEKGGVPTPLPVRLFDACAKKQDEQRQLELLHELGRTLQSLGKQDFGAVLLAA
ncbi:hypothetical protein HPB47_013714 [Ixodes persulcatus]|uniref:Uncharacterized protein n=1 Tax=Ixodes persulcatus TaxID=34615 RepID=A0AC60QXX0_IXOPE|nr:hypothetical protein HPB47_013714 [Ixodes persulcatus]